MPGYDSESCGRNRDTHVDLTPVWVSEPTCVARGAPVWRPMRAA